MARPQARKTASVRRRTAQQPGSSGTVWLLVGVILALFIFGLMYLASHKTHHVPPAKAAKPQLKRSTATKSKPASSTQATQQFDFYTLLPEMQVDNEQPSTQVNAAPVVKTKANLIMQSYVLQAGAFKRYADADKVRAQLILQGFNVQIKQVEVKGVTWQRITLGPFKSLAEARQAQDKLSKNGMKSLLYQVS